MRYWICGDKYCAVNPKVGSSSLARAIIAAHHPQIEQQITTAAYPAGKSADTAQWHAMVPYRMRPDGDVVCLVRDPIERFRSAMAQVRLTDVDATLHELEHEDRSHPEYRRRRLLTENPHFRPQTPCVGDPVHYLRFPDQIEQACEILGLAYPLPVINEATGAKPELTTEQESRVRAIYADDVALYESLD